MSKRIAVLGAGAIGAAIGAYFLRQGHDVTLIDYWAAHVEKIKRDGLKLTDLRGEFTVKANALHLSEVCNLRDQFDIVYLCVKSYDTLWSAHLVAPYLKPTGFILPAQNSLNDEVVASVVGYTRTVGCVPTISVGVYQPGHVIRTDPLTVRAFIVGELSGLITPRVLEVVKDLQVIGPSEATTNIWGVRWSKLVVNCMMNALSGIIGAEITFLDEKQQDLANLIRLITGGEVVRVAQAHGLTLEPIFGLPADELAEATTMGSIKLVKEKLATVLSRRYQLAAEQIKKLGVPDRPSLLQDIMKGRRTEVDYLNGLAVKKGEEVGVPTPVNKAILELTKKIEAGEVKPDPANLERLKPYLPV